MKKILLACDLDNTLIHSYKHKTQNDICIEILNGKEQGFMTSRTRKLLDNIPDNIILLPVTTRSVEQYMRIQWEKSPEYALVTNGTILLKDNIPIQYEDINKYIPEIESLKNKINPDDFMKIKTVDNMYLFVYCNENSDVKSLAEKYSALTSLNTQYSGRKIYFFPPPADKGKAVKKFAEKYSALTSLNTQYSGRKIYFFPPPADKGKAVKKFAENYNFDFIISAGDSSIDYPMLEISDIAIVPDKNTVMKIKNPNIRICPGNMIFSDFILETVLQLSEDFQNQKN